MADPSLPNLHGDDPTRAGGDIVGPGGPYDRDAVVIDTTNAVILDHVDVSLVAFGRSGQVMESGVALMLEGRINKTPQRTKVVYMLNADGVAAIVTELLGVAKRAEGAGQTGLAGELRAMLGERWDEMPK